ncbi:GntR family transcriptional regulator [Arthrobacter cavernae]|uniref:GntR family transcriptional regulator n=1 Tax=Arthrobacter cavernae TaxID=2817681 RepID=A0A939KPK6_9MICC|nr:GntR family transcriptional regulator [Arthrobacter cavernae]MBO1268860.1 GntR family transcriptional regulator [Arthrobacter cavernae]
MTDNDVRPWAGPLRNQPGLPLRVAAYSRIAEAIRRGTLRPGSLLPTETELGTAMEVSRTVVREALMLLEEDGLVRAKRGVGRFVSESLPRLGVERIQPFEDLLAIPDHPVSLERIQAVRQPASEFIAPGIGAEMDQECLLWETVISRDGEKIAHLQEHISTHPGTPGGREDVAAALAVGPGSGTMLTALTAALGPTLGPGRCDIGLTTAGPSRAKLLDLRGTDSVMVLTQYVQRDGAPFYLAKCLVTARAGHLSVRQS